MSAGGATLLHSTMTATDISFHFPPDLLTLLVDTIPRLMRSKKDVILFFRGAGVEGTRLADLERQVNQDRSSISKFQIARTILTRLNEVGAPGLRERREVVKRVVEYEDFSTCWENDRLAAQGLVQQVRHLVGVKDSFTRMKDERERERAEHRRLHEANAAAVAKRDADRDAIKRDFAALFADTNPWRRGKSLEAVLNRLFQHCGVLVREAFTLRGNEGQGIVEQIDGVIELDSHVYLVEMKWYGDRLGVAEIGQHLLRVFTRGGDVRALIVSDSGFSEPAIEQCRNVLAHKVIVLCELEELFRSLDADGETVRMLQAKAHRAMINREPFSRPTR